jgi:hypothetical protein
MFGGSGGGFGGGGGFAQLELDVISDPAALPGGCSG